MSKPRKRRGESKRNLREDIDEEKDDDLPLESDEFYKKWAGPVLLGPFLPAIFASFVILAGQLVLNTSSGTCGYNLPSVIGGFIGVSYVFLLVFTWVYLGDEIKVIIPMADIDRVVLTPFKSLKWVMGAYLVIGGVGIIIAIYGAFILSLATFCQKTAPDLYQFSLFVVVLYWLGFFIVFMYGVKLFYGTKISKFIEEKARDETIEEVENRLVRMKFNEFDKNREERVKREDLHKILQSLGVFVPEEEQEHLADTLDPDGTGYITFKAFSDWFKMINSNNEEDDGSDKDDEDRKLFS